jgi:hypothetical protein
MLGWKVKSEELLRPRRNKAAKKRHELAVSTSVKAAKQTPCPWRFSAALLRLGRSRKRQVRDILQNLASQLSFLPAYLRI